MSAIVTRQSYKVIAVIAALAFVYAAVLTKLGRDWWHDENYSHGLLIPFIIGYILWREREQLQEARKNPSWWGAVGVVLSLIALWMGTAGAELFVQRVSLVVMLVSVVVYFWGFVLLRLVSIPLFLLMLSIPIPQIIFNKIAFPLQIFASRCAVTAMSVMSIPVLRQGNVIELMPRGARETKKLAVVEACSGIRSLMTLVTLAVVYAYFTWPTSKTPDSRTNMYAILRSLILISAAVPIAILTNAMRVSGTGVLAHYYGTQIADGFFHSFSGWVIYVIAAAMLLAAGWSLDRIMKFSSARGDRTATPRNITPAPNQA